MGRSADYWVESDSEAFVRYPELSDEQLAELEAEIDGLGKGQHKKSSANHKKNCGIGAGGFQPVNTCARGGGGSGKPSSGRVRKPLTSKEKYMKGGKWTAERKALHDKIIDDIMAKSGATPVKNPTAYMMGGGPASGKSTALGTGKVKLPENLVKVDTDEIKKMLPEYQQMTAAGDSKAAAYAHDESSYISKKVMSRASKGGYNVMLDGTGDSSLYSVKKKVDILRQGGHKVIANYMTIDTDVSLKINEKRAEETGRYVPKWKIREAHAAVSEIVPQAMKAGVFDELHLFDNNIKDVSRPVLSFKRGKTKKQNTVKLYEPELYKRFLMKAF